MGGAVSRSVATSSNGVHPGAQCPPPRAPSPDNEASSSGSSAHGRTTSLFPPIRGPSASHSETQPHPPPAAASPDVAALEAKVQALMGTVEQLQRQMLSMREEHESQLKQQHLSPGKQPSQSSPQEGEVQPTVKIVDTLVLDRLARLEGSVSEVKEALDGERAAKEFAKQLARVHQSGIPTGTLARPLGGMGPMAGLLVSSAMNSNPLPEEVSSLLPPPSSFPKARSRSVNNRERRNTLSTCEEGSVAEPLPGTSLPPAAGRRRAGGQRMVSYEGEGSPGEPASSSSKNQVPRRRQTGLGDENSGASSSLAHIGRDFPPTQPSSSLRGGPSPSTDVTPLPRVMRRSVGGNEGHVAASGGCNGDRLSPVMGCNGDRLSPVMRDASPHDGVEQGSQVFGRIRGSSPSQGSRLAAFLLPGGIGSPTPSSPAAAAPSPIDGGGVNGTVPAGVATHRLGSVTPAVSGQLPSDSLHPGESTSSRGVGTVSGGCRLSPRGQTVSAGGAVNRLRDSDDDSLSIIGLSQDEPLSAPPSGGGGGFNMVQRYSNVLPSDLALVEQMKQGGGPSLSQSSPKQFL